MNRELTSEEKVAIGVLESLGWKLYHNPVASWYSNGKHENTLKDSIWYGNYYLLIAQYEISKYYKQRLVYKEKSDHHRGIYRHEFYYVEDYVYLLPNGQLVESWEQACDITINKLCLGHIEGSEYESIKRASKIQG